ncbi:MAG: TMEM14 family protein [Planctomycetota bacterium]|jgi:uncharacterized membrane protein (UPF0136 family)
MLNLAAAVALVYGLTSLFGGLQGYIAKKSVPSLVAGGIAGILLVLAAVLVLKGRGWGLWATLVVSIALVGRFLPAYLKDTGNVWPALLMALLGAATVVTSALALFAERKPAP